MFNTECLLMFRRFLPTHILNNVNNVKYICTSSLRKSANYYEALGIAKSSTQNEIKSAYYKLSMQYHPDKNKGCEISAKKFREISQAYEVLGNYRLRRLYDKGIYVVLFKTGNLIPLSCYRCYTYSGSYACSPN